VCAGVEGMTVRSESCKNGVVTRGNRDDGEVEELQRRGGDLANNNETSNFSPVATHGHMFARSILSAPPLRPWPVAE
jgi:hypothetical protein